MSELELRPLDRLWQVCYLLDAALCVTAADHTTIGRNSVTHGSRLSLLAIVKPAPRGPRWRSRRERLRHGTTLASCALTTRPRLDEAAQVLLDVLAPLLAEHQRRHAA